MSLNNIGKIEKWIFYFLGGYALLSSLTIAGGNIFLGLATVAAIVRLVKKHDDWRELLTVDKTLRVPFFIFLGIIVATSLFSTDIKTSVDTLLNHYVNRIMPFFLVILFVRDKESLIKLAALAGISTVINDLVCVLQFYGYIGEGKYVGRAPGLIGIMMTAGMVSMWVPVLALLFAECTGKTRCIVGMALLVGILGAICNNTRGAWLAIAITVCVIFLIYAKNKLKIMAVLIVIALAGSLIVNYVPWMQQRVISMTQTHENKSNLERLYLWESARNMATDYPVTGVGYGCFKEQYQTKYILPDAQNPTLAHAHNNFFHILAEDGYPGAVAVCIWWLGTLVYCVRGWRRYHNIGYLIFTAIFLGVMLQGLTEYTMGDSIVMKLFWFGLGLSYQWTKIKDDEIQSGAV